MADYGTDIPLFEDEEIVQCTLMPHEDPAPVIGTDLLVELISHAGTQMPVASRALDLAPGQGRFEAEFARDALIMSKFVSQTLPELTLITVRRLAQVQGTSDKTENGHFSDREEPGRIPHEIREDDDPIAQEYSAKFGWQWPYFGSVDATPMFISACAQAERIAPGFMQVRVTQRDGIERTLAEAATAAVEWLVRKLQSSPINLLESTAASNACWQAWMDSPDAYHHADGSLARGSVAAVEVQGFAYDALLDAARLAQEGLIALDTNLLWTLAQRLRRSFISNMWVAPLHETPYFASGVERSGLESTPFAVRTANMGLLLESRLLDGGAYQRFVDATVAHLQDRNGLWSANGIRTLANGEARFRPQAYHNGSVWPWQNLAIARGLRRHGLEFVALEIEAKMLEVTDALGCMPEFVVGNDEPTPTMNDAEVIIRSPDGHGEYFEHALMSIPQRHQGWTIFGIYALETATAVTAAA